MCLAEWQPSLLRLCLHVYLTVPLLILLLPIGLTAHHRQKSVINWLACILLTAVHFSTSLCCTHSSNNLSLLCLTLSTPPPSSSICFSPLGLAHTACFLLHHCHHLHQSHSLIASVGCSCGWDGGQAAAGEGTGGTDCLQLPEAEVIFSSRSGSRPPHRCNPVSRPYDLWLSDYVD